MPRRVSNLNAISRRDALRVGVGMAGLGLPAFLGLRDTAAAASTGTFGKAKSCIVLYCWGGMSHIDTWDTKPNAPAEVRGEFKPIATATPGIQVGEHIPLLARQTEKLAIIRSIHHRSTFHGRGMYWNLTGHPTPNQEQFTNLPPSRADWPNIGAMISKFRQAQRGFPNFVQIPYPMIDNHTLQAGDSAGFLGMAHDPVIVRPSRGTPYGGVSRDLGNMSINTAEGIDSQRLQDRLNLSKSTTQTHPWQRVGSFEHFQQKAADLLLSREVTAAFDIDREPPRLRDAYGEHLCGTSMLLARRLIEASVPVVHVICAAGDLNGASGDMWDTHGDNFNRLKNRLLPPFDRAFSALLTDLADRGRLDETLIVMLTDFGRTPKIGGGSGRDHYPFAYSVVLAGGGIRGGQVYGRTDRSGAFPADNPCSPEDIHATLFHALGIPGDTHLEDSMGRRFPLTEGRVLPAVG